MLRWLTRFLYPDRPRKNRRRRAQRTKMWRDYYQEVLGGRCRHVWRRRNGQAGLEITVDPETGVCDICGERIHGGIE